MTKGKDDQKLNHKESDIKNKRTPEQKSQPQAFEETTSKGRKNEKQGKAQPSGRWHKTGSSTQGAKQENQWFPGTLE